MEFKSLPGFRDVYPADAAVRRHLVAGWREVAHRYGFEEYDGPPLETLELYVAKSGEEIVGQLYNFADKGERQVAMRPEMTPTLARMVASKGPSLRKPIKWFAIPQLFRYERQQKGRLREHWQFNMDILGEADVAADAELLAAAIDALRSFGLGPSDFRARFSDRRLMAAILRQLGVSEATIPAVYAVIDKWERQPHEVSLQKLLDLGMSQSAMEELVLALQIHSIGELDEFRHSQKWDSPEIKATLGELRRYVRILGDYGLGDYLYLDLTIVRGLAYYTGIVFELFDAKGELRAICGGGRYDRLVETLGGAPLPALGFGMGDVVLGELLKQRGLLPEYKRTIDYYLIQVSDDVAPVALALTHALREQGHSVDRSFTPQGVGKQLKAAVAAGAAKALIVGPDEVFGAREVVERNLATGDEQRQPLADLLGETALTALMGRLQRP